MLADVLRRHLRPGHEVLDVCTGSGALAVTAACHGAGRSVAVDVSRRAVLTVRMNARRHGVHVDARQGDLLEPVAGETFDLIVSNPPYVPAAEEELPRFGRRRAWDAGTDGRVLLDRLCAEAPAHLKPGGVLLLVHSSVCGEATTLAQLTAAALEAEITERHTGPLGPILTDRRDLLAARGLLAPDAEEEDVVVMMARRPA